MSEVRCPKCTHPVPHLAEFVGKEAVCMSCGTHFKIRSLDPGASKTASQKVVWISAETALNESSPCAGTNKR